MADVSKATQMNNGLAIQVYNEQSCLLMEKRMRTAYQSAIDELQKELDDFYEKYATNNKIDLQVAKQKLSLSDSENVKDLAEQYKQLLSKKNILLLKRQSNLDFFRKNYLARMQKKRIMFWDNYLILIGLFLFQINYLLWINMQRMKK